MKKFILTTFTLLIVFFSIIVVFLSTNGYETNRFNNLIIKKVNNVEPNVQLKLDKIKIKLDIKKLNLFLSTNSIKVNYENINIPIYEIKVYFDLLKTIRSELHINKIIIKNDEINVKDVQKLLVRIKPSNFKSFILNNISDGKIKSSLDLDFKEDLRLKNYKVNGYIKNVNINIYDKFNIKDLSLNFITDDKTTLINSIVANLQGIPINGGEIKLERSESIIVKSSINTEIKKINKDIEKLISKYFKNDFLNKKIEFTGNFLSQIDLKFDKDLKLLNYNYNLSGTIIDAILLPKKVFKSSILQDKISKVSFKNTKINLNYNISKKNTLKIEGEYNLNENNFDTFKIENNFEKVSQKIKIDFNFSNKVLIELINYKKDDKSIANISSEIEIIKNEKIIKKMIYKEKDNQISINNLRINKNNKIKNLKDISVLTFKEGEENNSFKLIFGKKILVTGRTYDSTNLIKNLNKKEKNNYLSNITKEIRISFENILTKLSIPLNNFNLIGKIEKGKFVKISSKSEFSENQFLDITLKKNPNNKKKVLEIYSDSAKAMLADFNFFKGIEGGQLLFVSTFDEDGGYSNLQIKNFKVLNAPAFAKLLALADLGGIAVLLSGEGLEFESLEIKIKDDKKIRQIEEIYAVGPSITILMDGYIENESGLTSLRGTMVPAKEINKLISKIPVLGNILIGKEAGEGVFGVSFKMKGLPGKVKTTVNPIKTLTPRFITRALEKRKKENKNN